MGTSRTVLRLLLIPIALAVVAFAVVRTHDVRTCDDARQAVIRREPDAGRQVQRACRGGAVLAQASGGALAAGDVSEAGRLAQAAISRDPDDVRGWAALLYVLERRGSTAAAGRARTEIARLDPRGALRLSKGRSTK